MDGFQLGAWWVDPASGEISKPGYRRHLQPRQMNLLAHLAAHPGRMLTKEELLRALWHGAAVEEIALPRCVSEVRRALGDDARAPSYIETIPKRGYRLVATRGEAGDGARGASSLRSTPRRRGGLAAALTLAGAAIAGVAAARWLTDGKRHRERGG